MTDDPGRRAAILAAHGLDDREYDLLEHVWIEQAPPDEFVVYVRNLVDWDREQYTRADKAKVPAYVAALDRLLARGVLVVLTAADIEQERRRRAQSDLPELRRGFLSVRPGFIDYSAEGYALTRQVTLELVGEEGLARHDTAGDHYWEEDRWEVLSPRADICADHVASISRVGRKLLETHGPVPIGSWRPNRFIVRPQGFRATLRFEPRGA